ncbi:unnamed protein product [Camellia sinensis]
MNRDLEVIHKIKALNLFVVDPHRRERTSAARGGDHQTPPPLHRRQHRRRRKTLQIRRHQPPVRHNVESQIRDVRVAFSEDRFIVESEQSESSEIQELRVLHSQSQCENAEAADSEAEHGVFEHQAHDIESRHRRRRRKRERTHSLDVARNRREMRNEASKAVNNHAIVVVEVRISDLHAADEYIGAVFVGGDCDASAGG